MSFTIFLAGFTVTFLFPLLMSLKLLARQEKDLHEKSEHWITYWITFILLNKLSHSLNCEFCSQLILSLLILYSIPRLRLPLILTHSIKRIPLYLPSPIKLNKKLD